MAPDGEAARPDAPRRETSNAESDVPAVPACFHECEERLRMLANSAPIFVWTSGPDAMLTFANRTWLELRGRTLDEEKGNGWLEGLHPDDRPMCLETYLRGFTARQPYRFTARVLKAIGDYTWCMSAAPPALSRTGRPSPGSSPWAWISASGAGPSSLPMKRPRAWCSRSPSANARCWSSSPTVPHQGGRREPGDQLQDGRFPSQPYPGEARSA